MCYKKYGVHQGLSRHFDLVWLQYSSSARKTQLAFGSCLLAIDSYCKLNTRSKSPLCALGTQYTIPIYHFHIRIKHTKTIFDVKIYQKNLMFVDFLEIRVRIMLCKEPAKGFSFSELLFLNNSQTKLKMFNKFLL